MSTATERATSALMTVGEAADELHVTERYIRKVIATGELPAVKVGRRLIRIRRTDLEALLRPARAPFAPL
jgi:excisionase family DNA binding protein